ncbi:TonB-dependent receptor [Catenovulum agarivorans DS-2]|uniref:TonB-dependent receptor n=1 Tax=Catenovulum agarivorans DS-2 TaxID=1328313 RepID=W7QC85_9ALTE|nr:TonB-dependent receptor [Catenovulum agarivorans]EWH10494.1 TonB-dependent receptor [Catenovulum agarivorans DS-2]
MNKIFNKRASVAVAITAALNGYTGLAMAQSSTGAEESTEVIEVQGIRSALASALNQKRDTTNITEIIKAEDIGKLPDNNLAEVLENVTGVQIDRTNGVGTSVQIRGTDANRVEINGVSTVSSGSGRTGISFEDLPAALIAAVEVTKAPTAKTVEGSVGGTINLKTLRGNSLRERLTQVKVQMENSDLADSTTPKISATYGDNWETGLGKLGLVVTGSYAEQDVASANPRFDRDRVVMPNSGRASARSEPFLRTQFLDQPLNAKNYETKNLTTSIELKPTDNFKIYLDATINDQESVNTNSRAYFSGTGANPVIDNTNNTGFEKIDLGSLDGAYGPIDLGEVEVVTSGILGVGVSDDGEVIDPNLRVGNNSSARVTESRVFAFGSEYRAELLTVSAEVSYSDSESNNPSLNSELDFVNPRGPQVSADTRNDNGTPAEFRIANNRFEFGIAQGLPETPTTEQLLNPANYALRSVNEGFRYREGAETAARLDLKYDIADTNPIFTEIHAGVRWNKSTNMTRSETSRNSFGNWNRPRANLFSEIVVPGASNFNGADGRELYVKDYLIIDNGVSFNNPAYTKQVINSAITANNKLIDPDFDESQYNTMSKDELEAEGFNALLVPMAAEDTQFFDIEEETTAFYIQSNYDFELGSMPFMGNLGVRYVSTEINSLGNELSDGAIKPRVGTSSYDFVLPRFNLTAEVADDMLVRLGIGKDLRRPDFDDLSTSASFGGSASAPVNVGNPDLKPEQVWSYDLSWEYYLSPSALVSVGLFHKERTDLHVTIEESPEEPIGSTGQIERDTTAPCEGGGIYNPVVPWENFNVFSSVQGEDGICVAKRSKFNANGTQTQSGAELAVQYDLSDFEGSLGWASGFGIIANYTYQEAGEGLTDFYRATSIENPDKISPNAIDTMLGRDDWFGATETTEDDPVTSRVQPHKLSKHSYNFTLFYDKHDLSVRMRYTWRDAFTEELSRMRFNIPPVVGARGQLNMSVNYKINDTFSFGIDGVNLTQEDRTRWCFNENTLLCEQSLTDRRVTASLSAKF